MFCRPAARRVQDPAHVRTVLTLIAWSISATASAQQASVTFARDIAPLVYARCATCHRPAGASFSLISYDEVKSRATLIARATRTRFMPPWRPEPGQGVFAGDRRLSDREIALFERWVEGGAPLGDAAQQPPAPQWTSEWRLGTPDLIVPMPEAYTLRAGGDDMYRNFVLPIRIAGNRYVKAWEFQPGNALAVHHATMHLDPTRASRLRDEQDPAPGYEGLVAHSARTPDGFFLDWAPGHTPLLLPAGMGWPIEAGSDLVLMLHLRPSGKPETIRARVGLYFADTPPTRTPVMVRLNRGDLDIAADDKAYRVTHTFRLPVDVDVYTVQPHAHYLAREVTASATLPDGRIEPLIQIKDWAFEWQDVYQYAQPVYLPAGTTIAMDWRYDNSAGNPRNPFQPPRRVAYGQRTSDEMSELWLQVVPRRSEDRAALVRGVRASVLPQEIRGHEMMLQSDADNAPLHDDTALLYAEAGNLDQSLAHFTATLRLRPDYAPALYNVGTALLLLGRRSEAIRHFSNAIAIDPNYALAHQSLGAAFDAEGRTSDAIDRYLTASWLLATSPEPPINSREPVALAERAIALQGTPSAKAYDVLAAACAADGQFDRALTTAESALELASRSRDARLASEIRQRLDAYRRRERTVRRPEL